MKSSDAILKLRRLQSAGDTRKPINERMLVFPIFYLFSFSHYLNYLIDSHMKSRDLETL